MTSVIVYHFPFLLFFFFSFIYSMAFIFICSREKQTFPVIIQFSDSLYFLGHFTFVVRLSNKSTMVPTLPCPMHAWPLSDRSQFSVKIWPPTLASILTTTCTLVFIFPYFIGIIFGLLVCFYCELVHIIYIIWIYIYI